MNWMDAVTAAFEVSGGVFLSLNAWDLYKKKAVAGQTLLSTIFFGSWAVWNVYYFAALSQPLAMFGAVTFLPPYVAQIWLILRYRHNTEISR